MSTNPTINYKFSRPLFNSMSWHDDMNGNFTVADALFKAIGLASIGGAWATSTLFPVGTRVIDPLTGITWQAQVTNTSGTTTLADDILANPTWWATVSVGIVVREAFVTGVTFNVGDFIFQTSEYLAGIVETPFVGGATLRTNIANLGVIYDIKTAMTAITGAVTQTGLDRIATAADRVQTGLDRVATGQDKVATAADRVVTTADRVQTGLDRVATAADRVVTTADRVQTQADRVATAADRVQTGLDRVSTTASSAAVATAAVPLGYISMRVGPDLPAGHLAYGEGGTYDPLVYPQFATWMATNHPELASGNLPDYRDYVPRTAGGALGPALRTKQEDAGQLITGGATFHGSGSGTVLSAGTSAIVPRNARAAFSGGTFTAGPTSYDGFNFDSSASPGARTATETRVKSFGVRWMIKVYGAIVDQGTASLVAIQQSYDTLVNGAVRKDILAAPSDLQMPNLLKNIRQSWETLAEVSISGATSSIIQPDINLFRAIHIEGWLLPTADASNIFMRFASDGVSFDGGANYNNLIQTGSQGAGVTMADGATIYIDMSGYPVSNLVGRVVQINSYVYQAKEVRATRVITRSDGINASNVGKINTQRGVHAVAAVQNALQIAAASTTLALGELTIRGKR